MMVFHVMGGLMAALIIVLIIIVIYCATHSGPVPWFWTTFLTLLGIVGGIFVLYFVFPESVTHASLDLTSWSKGSKVQYDTTSSFVDKTGRGISAFAAEISRDLMA